MTKIRQRPLVLRDEGIRHPFRQNLPIEFLRNAREEHHLELAAAITAETQGKWPGEEISLFLLSFLAFFTAFYLFIF